jgi:hypothetical protein
MPNFTATSLVVIFIYIYAQCHSHLRMCVLILFEGLYTIVCELFQASEVRACHALYQNPCMRAVPCIGCASISALHHQNVYTYIMAMVPDVGIVCAAGLCSQ